MGAETERATATRAADDLEFIRRVIEESRRTVALDATPFLVWGGLVIAGIVIELLVVRFSADVDPVWIWMTLIAIGLLSSLRGWRRRRRRLGASGLAERALAAVWWGCWMAMVGIGFGGYFLAGLSGAPLIATLAAVMGVGFFATGALTDHDLLRWLGPAWWLTALALFALSDALALLVFGAAVLSFQVLPGLAFQRRWRSAAGRGDAPISGIES